MTYNLMSNADAKPNPNPNLILSQILTLSLKKS